MLYWEQCTAWFDGALPASALDKGSDSKRITAGVTYAKAKLNGDYQALNDSLAYYDYETLTSSSTVSVPLYTLSSLTLILPRRSNKLSLPQYALLNKAFIEYEIGSWFSCSQVSRPI